MSIGLLYSKYFSKEEFLPESIPIINEFICYFCDGVYKEPTLDVCGDIYCKRCIETWMKESNLCPKTNIKIKHNDLVPMNYIQNIIVKQIVYCKNRNHGCEWTGKIINFDDHLINDCKKLQVKCKNSKCETVIFRENIRTHEQNCEFRKVSCQYCREEVPFNTLILHVDQFCQKIKIFCSNLCGLEIERGELKTHSELTCDNSIVKCPLMSYGCEVEMLRKDVQIHKSDLQHNLKIIQFFERLNDSFLLNLNNYALNYDQTIIRLTKFEEKLKTYDNIERIEKIDTTNKVERVLQQNNETNNILEKAKIRVENLAKIKREREKTENSKRFDEISVEYDKFLQLEHGNFMDENIKQQSSNSKIKIKKCEKINSIFKKNLKVVILKDNHQISLTEWKFNFEENVFGFGMCLKEIIVKNQFQIINNKGLPHGCFIISSTGLLLSSSNENENLKEVNNFRKIELNEEIRIISHLLINEIIVKIRDSEYKFSKVCLNDKTLVPCKVLIVDR